MITEWLNVEHRLGVQGWVQTLKSFAHQRFPDLYTRHVACCLQPKLEDIYLKPCKYMVIECDEN